MKKHFVRQKGMSLVEVLIALGVLGIVAYTLSSLQVNSLKIVGQISNQSTHNRSIAAIEADVLKEDRFLPTYTRIDSLESTSGSPRDRLDSSFKDSSVSPIQRCYNSTGSRVMMRSENEPVSLEDCFYRVAFYKIAIRDLRYPSDSKRLDRLPMSRINIQVKYKAKENNKDVEKIEYLSRLVTQVMAF